jgi:hypothetical protein
VVLAVKTDVGLVGGLVVSFGVVISSFDTRGSKAGDPRRGVNWPSSESDDGFPLLRCPWFRSTLVREKMRENF